MKWTPLHTHSHFSLLDGLSKPKQIAQRCAELGYTACALTDHGSLSGAAAFVKACKGVGIKPILGCELYITDKSASIKNNKTNKVRHQLICAKNLTGWKQLVQLVSRSNDEDVFYYKPRIDLEIIQEICTGNNLISFSGHPGSTLDIEDDKEIIQKIHLMQDIFGKENFFVEIQLIDVENNPDSIHLGNRLRYVAKATNTKTIATGDSHYTYREDAKDHHVLLCSSLKTTIKQAKTGHAGLEAFFKTDNFCIPSVENLSYNTNNEIENTFIIEEMCENYDITSPPKLPTFPWTRGMSEKEYLQYLCREGWQKRKKPHWGQEYVDRLQKELGVFSEAKLEGYFLIVQDYVNYAKTNGWLVGSGRGSAAGCLVSYLLGITNIDPIPYDLVFERFYNAGRNTKDRVSYPDIDVDFPKFKRGAIIEYLKEKYGQNRVCQMATFGRLMGRGALKEVFRVHGIVDFNTSNDITKNLPQEAEISDKLEESGETSIIRWTLNHDPKLVEDYCHIGDDGNLVGQYASEFAQAIRLEGTFKTQGKHAAGVIISAEDLNTVCPMIKDKNSSDKIAGMDGNAMESMGHIKFDILGVGLLDKLMGVNNLLKYGRINP